MATEPRYRDFATIVYPTKEEYLSYCALHNHDVLYNGWNDYGSAPENWKDLLADLHIPCFISPMHTEDVDEDGQIKKPHYHIHMIFSGKKSENQIRKIVPMFSGVGVEIIADSIAYARYLCHLDEDAKISYKDRISEVIAMGGLDYLKKIITAEDDQSLSCEIIDFIEEYQIFSYRVLCLYSSHNRPEWFQYIKKTTIFWVGYLRSKTYDYQNSNKTFDFERIIEGRDISKEYTGVSELPFLKKQIALDPDPEEEEEEKAL